MKEGIFMGQKSRGSRGGAEEQGVLKMRQMCRRYIGGADEKVIQ